VTIGILAIAAASGLTTRVPTGRWVVDYADEQCIAKRQFGTTDKPLVLIIKPSPTSDVVQLNLVKNGSGDAAYEYDARLSIGGAGPIRVRQLNFGTNDKASKRKYFISQINLSGEQATTLSSAERIGWYATAGAHVTLETGKLDALMRALATCRENLREYWNIGTANEQALKTPVEIIKPINSLFSTQDYPAQSVRQGDGGTSTVIVLIDETGRTRDCMLEATSGIASIDGMTCAVIRERGRFKPAIGAEGKPVRSYVKSRVRWELP
jgi:hypothetical protein